MLHFQDFANNLIESGVHGALVALDDSFSWQSMALALQIPTQNSHARNILEREFNTLLQVIKISNLDGLMNLSTIILYCHYDVTLISDC